MHNTQLDRILSINRDENDFFDILEQLPYGIILVQPDKKIYFANGAALKMADQENMKGKLCFETFCLADECNCPLEKEGDLFVSKKELRRKDGSSLPVIKTAQNFLLNGQQYFLEVFTDNSEQIRDKKELYQKTMELEQLLAEKQLAEQKAQKEAEKFEALFEDVPDAVFVHDLNGKILKVNPKACQQLGYTKDELLSMSLADIDSPASRMNAHKHFQTLVNTGNAIFEASHVSKNGTAIPVEVFSKTIEFDGDMAVLSSVRNLSKHKQYEQELVEAKIRAEESDRLKAQFLNNISHEIRTPLNGIIGFLDLFEDENFAPEERRKVIEIMRKSSDRLIETVTSIIEISNIEKGLSIVNKQSFILGPELDKIITETSRWFQDFGVVYRWQCNDEVKGKTVHTDKSYLQLILRQLIQNARKFTNEGSVVVKVIQNKRNLEIRIEDTGVGIEEKELKTIFKPFMKSEYTIKKCIDGNGLGLTLAKKLATALNGDVTVKSEFGKGSVFTLSLPLVFQSDTNEKHEIKTEPSFKDKTILVVEDEISNFLFLETVLSKTGCNVIHAINGSEAIHIGLNGKKIDLIIMDLKMPSMDGFTATRKLREGNLSIPIIAHSAFVLNNERERAFEAGCNDFLAKPVRRTALLEIVAKNLYGGTQYSS